MLLCRGLLLRSATKAGPSRPKEEAVANDYEILLMLDPELPEERQDEIVARVRELIEKGGGTWVGHDPWGRRKLAYEIDKKTDGIYHLLQFDAEPETLDELTRILKITDGVMRHLATRRIKGDMAPAAQARSRSRAPAGSPSTLPRTFVRASLRRAKHREEQPEQEEEEE